jgi:predicted lipoprotein with Yx(FWY)xxD motif
LASAAALSVGVGSASASAHGTKISLRKTSHGKVLVTSKGFSLYDFSIDKKNTSKCNAVCRIYWHPLKTSGTPVAGTGVKKSLLGHTSKGQATYDGKPLYTYVGDTKAGKTTGEGSNGSGGRWWLVNAKGHSVK